MNDLVQRLATGNHRVRYSRADKPSDLKAAIDRGYVLLRFTETRGGTEVGVSLDVSACDWGGADFERGQGKVHLEGDLKLDYVPVRLIADVDVGSLEGSGHLRVLGGATSPSA
jgi:hypothetical protein